MSEWQTSLEYEWAPSKPDCSQCGLCQRYFCHNLFLYLNQHFAKHLYPVQNNPFLLTVSFFYQTVMTGLLNIFAASIYYFSPFKYETWEFNREFNLGLICESWTMVVGKKQEEITFAKTALATLEHIVHNFLIYFLLLGCVYVVCEI